MDINGGEIKDVPLTDPVFDSVRESIKNKWVNKPYWKERIEELLITYDVEKYNPLYYCRIHGRIEDGAHRYTVAELRGDPTIKIQGVDYCKIKPVPVIREIVEKYGRLDDIKWLEACHNLKWAPIKKNVDFRGKFLLDIGSQSGFFCIAAAMAGASHAWGLEIREKMIMASRRAAAALEIKNTLFINADWNAYPQREELAGKFDIVSAMGILHYFSIPDYLPALKAMAAASRETLIIEMRLFPSNECRLFQADVQSLPSPKWLIKNLLSFGFIVFKTFPIKGNKRQLWILKREG
jgi:2-polyprenyl-3-methyl-5-hydroxy-6-metoxy-1,4-benzoquinol methylase